VYPILKAVMYLWSLLPLPVLYLQSRLLALFAYHIVRYRKSVIEDNLRHAFPEKSDAEIKRIRRDFYRNFCDVIVEIVKLMSISEKEIKRRVRLVNPEAIDKMLAHGHGGVAVFSHFGNWEWMAAGLGLQLPFPTYGVYKPLTNKAFDKLMLHIRQRLKNRMITQAQAYRESMRLLQSPCYVGFLGDQNPAPKGKMYFTPFMGRPVPAHLGIATIALKAKAPMYYFDHRRVRRGQYTIELVELPTEDLYPFSKRSVHQLTDRHVEYLEAVIRTDPAAWLWSHRRWKRSPKPGDAQSEKLSES